MQCATKVRAKDFNFEFPTCFSRENCVQPGEDLAPGWHDRSLCVRLLDPKAVKNANNRGEGGSNIYILSYSDHRGRPPPSHSEFSPFPPPFPPLFGHFSRTIHHWILFWVSPPLEHCFPRVARLPPQRRRRRGKRRWIIYHHSP